ncbi:hypothetical protein GCM10009862_15950 [Microbacterium binotii]|uniref:Secreted protein n=1 Tax=Microbacterium binotii TaxID=462710 RepID=A0ABN3PBG0_9MICO
MRAGEEGGGGGWVPRVGWVSSGATVGVCLCVKWDDRVRVTVCASVCVSLPCVGTSLYSVGCELACVCVSTCVGAGVCDSRRVA